MSKNKIILSIFTASLTLLPQVASATPVKETECQKTQKITQPHNSSDYYFSENCDTAYVLPPASGKFEVGNFTESASIALCPAVFDLIESVNLDANTIRVLTKRMNELAIAMKEKAERAEPVKAQLREARALVEEIDTKLTPLVKELLNLKTETRDARTVRLDCRENLVDPSDPGCEEENAEYVEARKAYRDVRSQVYDLRDRLAVAEARKSLLTDEVYELDEADLDTQNKLISLRTSLADAHTALQELLGEYAGVQGAVGNMYYELDWRALMEKYREENPDFEGTFRQMPLDNMVFNLAAIIGDEEAFQMPVLLGVAVPGLGSLASVGTGPTGEAGKVDLGVRKTKFGPAAINYYVQGGHNNGANISVSLMGVCNSLDPKTNKVDPEMFKGLAQANVFYDYQIQAKLQYEATFNMSNWITQVERRTKRRTLVSSSTFHELSRGSSAATWFEIDFSGNDKDFQYSKKEQADIGMEVANMLQERAVKQLAVQNGVGMPDAPKAELDQTGAEKFGNKKCGIFFYCHVSNWVAKGLKSIFSNKSAVATFKRNNRGWQSHVVKGNQMLPRSGTTSFKSEDMLTPKVEERLKPQSGFDTEDFSDFQ